MIIRVLQARVHPGRQAEFRRILERLSIPQMQAKSGMLQCYPGETSGADTGEFVLVTLWKNLAILRERTLEEWVRAILPEEALPLLEEFRIQRYDAFGVPDEGPRAVFKVFRYSPEG